MSNRPTYAWDSDVFIAWLTADSRAPLDDIDAVVQEIDHGRANLVTAVTAHTEVLEIRNSAAAIEQFEKFLKRENVQVLDINVVVSKKAGEIRTKGLQQHRKIKTPDAQHIAVAILAKADVMHTFDDQLIKLSETAIVDGLMISPPRLLSGQMIRFPKPP